MADMMGSSHLLDVFQRKFEEFAFNVENKHMVWLREIEAEALRMFSSDFNAEPELMPKTPSQKRRRKKMRPSGIPDETEEATRRRLSRRSNKWRSSVRRLSVKLQNMDELENCMAQQEQTRATRQTRSRAQNQKPVCVFPESTSKNALEQPSFEPLPSCIPVVEISTKDRRSAEDVLELDTKIEVILLTSEEEASPQKGRLQPSSALQAPQTPDAKCRSASKVNIASTPKETGAEQEGEVVPMDLSAGEVKKFEGPHLEISAEEQDDIPYIDHSTEAPNEPTAVVSPVLGKATPTGSKSDRRSVRRSLVGRPSKRHSLMEKYSLASKRESMTREAMRKSIRRSISKKAWESSASSVSCQSSTEGVEEDTIKARPETVPSTEQEECSSPRRSLRSRNAKKIAISNLSSEPERPLTRLTRKTLMSKPGENKENFADVRRESDDNTQSARRKSYKRAVDALYDDCLDDPHGDDAEHSPPRKKTPSPPCPTNKVVRPPPSHMRSFLHTVQKNQMLMATPGSGSSSSRANIKSFIKRTTPLKVDIKGDFVEKERQRLENLRRKQEAEIQRKLKLEEEKKRKLEEIKLRREERHLKVLQARERVEQMGEEKKRKIEQKFAEIDGKSEKVREDRLAEEKAKKKLTAKKMEEVEVRRKQDDETRKLKIQQMEEEERKHQEMMAKKREEEEQERAKRIAEAKKLADLRQVEQERERQREQQVAAEKDLERKKDLERILAEKERERQEKEKVILLQREQERAAREEAAAQERERLWKEREDRKKKEQVERQEKLRKELEQERRAKEEQERRAKEEQERRAKEQQATTLSTRNLNVTQELSNSPSNHSYKMTPQGSKPKPPKICDEDYGMDLNSDDSTDDETEPRKPIPDWASGKKLNDSMRQQFYNPINVDACFGRVESIKLEDMFSKNKPRYFKRTSSAVWHSPPLTSNRSHMVMSYGVKKY